jgi:subtilisin family serine protease
VPSEKYIIEPLIEYKLPEILKSAQLPGGCGFNPPTPPPNPEPPPTDDPQEVDWGIARVFADEFLDRDSSSVTSCVIDTGTDVTHPDLAHIVGVNYSGGPSGDYQDFNGHGSHVHGLIAALNNSYGVVGASNASVAVCKGLTDQGSGTNAGLAACIRICADWGARFINASWGGPSYSQAIEASIKYFLSLDHRNKFIAAAGNDSSPNKGYPASHNVDYPGRVIAVSATNQEDELAYFSNYNLGPYDIAAPGHQILSTTPGGYSVFSGTSMSAPIVTGVMSAAEAAGLELQFDDMGDEYRFGQGIPNMRKTFGN